MRIPHLNHLLLLAAYLTVPSFLVAQLDLPQDLVHPEYSEREEKIMLNGSLDLNTEEVHNSRYTVDQPWHGFTDRSNVKMYDDAKLKKEAATIPAIGAMMTVLKESKETVQVRVHVSGKEGWVKKSELVLWPHPLVKKGAAGVDLKAFIVNTLDQKFIDKLVEEADLKTYYKIHDGPTSSLVLDRRQIYQILFVYKKDENSDRYLLSNNYKLTGDGQLLGWVDNDRVKIWDTALALEPNWEPKGMEERRKNKNFQAQVFAQHSDADKYYEGNSSIKNLNSNDPVNFDDNEEVKAILDPSGRFLGVIPRFPFLHQAPGDHVVSCGAIGKANVSNTGLVKGADDVDFGLLRTHVEKCQRNLDKLNVVFVAEATSGMKEYFRAIPQVVAAIRDRTPGAQRHNLRFGLVAYSDGTTCGAPSSEILQARIALTDDHEKFKQEVERVRMNVDYDGDVYAASKYGLMSGINDLGMKQYETNIIIHLGQAMDVSGEVWRADECSKAPFVDEMLLNQAFFDHQPSLISFQVKFQNKDGYKGFEDQLQVLMESVASEINDNMKLQHAFVKEGTNFQPTMKRNPGYSEIENAPSLMRIYYPDRTKAESALPVADLVLLIGEAYDASLKTRDEKLNALASFLRDDQTLNKAYTEYSSVFASVLANANFTAKQRELMASERVHTFRQAYTYLRAKEANYDTYKQVLFMKKSSVNALRDLFDQVEEAGSQADPEGLRDLLKSAMEKFAKSVLNIEDMEQEMDLSLLRSQITGVANKVGDGNSLLSRLSEVDDFGDLSDAEVLTLFRDMQKAGREFNDEVISPKNGYPFVYTAGISTTGDKEELKFYWIPVKYLF